jgi:uncharacterized protein
VYVDISVLDWIVPQREFHAYLKRLVDAGFATRIMFGSDQMVWPEAIEVAIDNVNAAAFLSTAQNAISCTITLRVSCVLIRMASLLDKLV